MAGARYRVKELTVGLVFILHFGGVLAEEVQELVALDLEVIGELFWRQVGRHGLSEGVAFALEDFEGAVMILFEGAGPGVVRYPESFFERFPFEDEGGELDGPAGGGSEASLGGGDESCRGVKAYGVPKEAGYAAGVFGCDPEFRPV